MEIRAQEDSNPCNYIFDSGPCSGSRRVNLEGGRKLVWEKEVLGVGTFGTVHKGVLTDVSGSVTKVAIKFAQSLAWDGEAQDVIRGEMKVYRKVGFNPNTVRYLAGRVSKKNPARYCIQDVFIVLEYIPRNLTDVLMSDKSFDTYRKALDLMLGVAKGLVHLHSHDILHHDLKPDNILVTDDYIPKIADFGASKIRCGRSITATWRGTAHYIAPECKLGGWSKTYYPDMRRLKEDEKVDTFSYGVILWEIATGGDSNPPGPEDHTIWWGGSVQVKCNCPEALRNLIENCLRFDLHQMESRNYGRPSCEDIVQELESMLAGSDWLGEALPPRFPRD